MEKISIIIPAYNEEKRIQKTLEAFSEYYGKLRNDGVVDYEILIALNNTTDRTEDIIKEFQRKDSRVHYLDLESKGKGLAVIGGFKNALTYKNDLIGFVDADMATSPEAFDYLRKNIGNHAGAIADRYKKSSKLYPPVTFRRIVVSRIFNIIVRSLLLLPYKDTQCGAKLFRREALEKVIPELSMSQWAFDVELLFKLHKKGLKVVSLPTVWVDRAYSTINFIKSGPWMALAIARLRILNSPLKKFVRIYDKFLGYIPK
jgi:glycosyltransferase involved in cell wall biosynthesis